MNKFSEFLIEDRHVGKNMHLEHLEDEIFNRGAEGARDSIYFLRSLRDMLGGHSSVPVYLSTKWDGAPSIVVGVNPDNGKYFIGTKGVFNVTPKIAYSASEIDSLYPDKGLARKLKIAFKYLKPLKITSVLQGDLMFVDGEQQIQTIENVGYVTFTPNTITYAVPLDSDLAKNIQRAKVGVVFHTEYRGETLASMTASFNPNINALTPSKDVWYRDAQFIDASGTATFTWDETLAVNHWLHLAEYYYRPLDQQVLNYIAQNDTIKGQIKGYINSLIRDGRLLTNSPQMVSELIRSVTIKLNQSIIDAKKSDTMRKREIEKNTILAFYNRNSQTLVNAFSFLITVTEAKSMILRKLQAVKGMGTFLKTDSGFKVTNPEGFVAVDHTGKAVKLVDRLEFSKTNFQTTKNWDQ